jgi:hypothetical protein
MKVKQRLLFTYIPELIKEPIIYNLGEQFNIVTNIHSADITEDRGWVILELEGEDKDIEEGISWATSRGMRIEPIGEAGDVQGNNVA